MKPKLRLLVLSPWWPTPSGTGSPKRVFGLISQLSSRHSVTLLTYPGERDDRSDSGLEDLVSELTVIPHAEPRGIARRKAQLRALPSALPFHARQFRSNAMREAVDSLLQREHFDLVQIESSQMCVHDYRTDAPIVIDEHNIEYELLMRVNDTERSPGRRFFNAVEGAKVRRLEHRWWAQADGCAVPSAREQQIVRSVTPSTPVAVVPNAVDLDYFRSDAQGWTADTLLFIGLLTYRPNLEAVRFLVSTILPRIRRVRPDVRLVVVGHGSPADLERLQGPGVVVRGWVPDVRPYLESAAVVVAPIRVGSGTRIKVLEAMAMGKVVVSTTVGCEGIDVRDGEHLLIADEPDDFGERVLRVLADPAMTRRIGTAARSLVAGQYSWARAADALDEMYDTLITPGRRAAVSGPR